MSPRQCPSCGGSCGRTAKSGCRYIAGPPTSVRINDRTVAFVCDRMLTAAIGPDWRKRAPEAVTAFWLAEVRQALLDAAREAGRK